MRRYGKLDANHNAIRGALEDMGCSVLSLASLGNGAPDLLAGYGGLCLPIECKAERGKLTEDQKKFFDSWKGGLYLARNLDDAANAMKCLRRWHELISGR